MEFGDWRLCSLKALPMTDQPHQDATVSMLTANLVAIALIPIAVLLFLLPYSLIWGDITSTVRIDSTVGWTAVLIFCLSIVAHERPLNLALAGAGWLPMPIATKP
jgi:predicted CDP-diglyceride synthetase/phosphatidate cytidylyltransferase